MRELDWKWFVGPVVLYLMAASSADAACSFRPAAVRVAVQDINGRIVPHAHVFAYQPDYKVPVGPVETDDRGECKMDLSPGCWKFIADGRSYEDGLYLSSEQPNLDDGSAICLRPDRIVTIQSDIPDFSSVHVIDSRFNRWVNAAVLGPGRKGRYPVQTSSNTPLEVLLSRAPARSRPGVLLYGSIPAGKGKGRMSINSRGCARVNLTAATKSPVPRSAFIEMVHYPLLSSPVTYTTALPAQFMVTPGFVEIRYNCEVPNALVMEYLPRGYELSAGGNLRLSLGGPPAISVYHAYWPQCFDIRNALVFHTFMVDANKHHLLRISQVTGTGLKPCPVPVEVTFGNDIVTQTADAEVGHQSAGKASHIDGSSDLSQLNYAIQLPFERTPRIVKGHGVDLRKMSEHFELEGPSELEEYAERTLEASEIAYDRLLELVPPPPWDGKRCKIEFTPFLDICGVARGRSWAVNSLTPQRHMHLARTQEWPLMHEMMHVAGFGHLGELEDLLYSAFPNGDLPMRPLFYEFIRGKPLDESNWWYLYRTMRIQFGVEAILHHAREMLFIKNDLYRMKYPEWMTECAVFDAITQGQAKKYFACAGLATNDPRLDAACKYAAEACRKKREVASRTLDSILIGRSEDEQAHKLSGERTEVGMLHERTWRHALEGGSFQYEMKVLPDQAISLFVTYWGGDNGRSFDIVVDGTVVATQTLSGQPPDEFIDREYPVESTLTKGKSSVTVAFIGKANSVVGGVFDIRTLRPSSKMKSILTNRASD